MPIWVYLYFSCFCLQPMVTCFAVDLLQRVVMSSTISFFVGFRVDSSDDKVQFDKVIRSNPIHHYVRYVES